ncbi:hypothetical protein ACIOUE_03565 [Streptomyces xanthochromogenes]|uniref:hypothetical protein n=1 Tax=Streptomyces TaxID=1883 RepID=UPI0013691E17|nr:hypothetical protein [Streptomyces sp. SID1034]MYV93988.1 hypothetical protein [Streptomyces sp. SID1034]
MQYINPQIRLNADRSGAPHAPEDIIAVRHALAEAVAQELRYAGLPACVEFSNRPAQQQAGACVSVSTADSPAGGVYVTWNPSSSMIETAQRSAEPGTFDLLEPVIEHSVRVGSLMNEALKRVLVLAGFRTRDASELNDLSSGLHIAGRQPRQWFIASILAEGVVGLIASIRTFIPHKNNPLPRAEISAETKSRLTERGIRIAQKGLHGLTADGQQDHIRVIRRTAGALHSQEMARNGFWEANQALLELADELCLPTHEMSITQSAGRTSPQVLTAAYIALLADLERTQEGYDEAIEISEIWTATLLRRSHQAPADDQHELSRLFRESATEYDLAGHTLASVLAEAVCPTGEKR